ncbi:hypothetical protein SNOG_05091 [Parastagonospora nodorum SN15]|uniref:Uncharacterized protein n=1 Tax=Phaeosphaeria nodorum (strain SN15 / ATCC MYA-4574 / FGSC 10173) TaxID=321614 RepID=Q0UT23_PHANO|nr:hypothetical protein SNOG_05091 [Parastagonospora nodorum SN15]EAT87482.1 hypothetical protein SNOG_05091 [Parastagonospora nodorum SN15]
MTLRFAATPSNRRETGGTKGPNVPTQGENLRCGQQIRPSVKDHRFALP